MIFVDIEVIPVLINQASEGNVELIYAIIGYISDHAKESMDFVYSLEYLIKKLIDPGEDYPADEYSLGDLWARGLIGGNRW